MEKAGSGYYYYQTDHLGTPQQLIDQVGTVVHTREMRAFGEMVEQGLADRWRFSGQLVSEETGFHYNYFRDYEPGIGRYAQNDPIGLDGGVNLHTYAHSSPIYGFDPYGLCEITGRWIQPPRLDEWRPVACPRDVTRCFYLTNSLDLYGEVELPRFRGRFATWDSSRLLLR